MFGRLVWVFTLPILFIGCRPSDPPTVAPAVAADATQPRLKIENPSYRQWSKFAVGTNVVQKTVTEVIGKPEKTVTTTTYILQEKSDSAVVVEWKTHTIRYDGFVTDNPPDRLTMTRYFELPPGATEPKVVPPGAEEDVILNGQTYHCRKVLAKDRNEAGEVNAETWYSDAVPGGLVRSISDTPAIGKRTTIELTSIQLP
jgi:hypothetical protein